MAARGADPIRPARMRLDQLLVERGLAESRTRAQALILAGQVFSGTKRLEKPGMQVTADLAVDLRGEDHPWVSRGGLKLAHALDHFQIDVRGLIGLDIGASTGGFTDVLLARGAIRVFAVDVGRGQLAWKLRQDPRVALRERTNARHLTRAEIPEAPGIIVVDASFIGLRTILPTPLALARAGTSLVALIKPQFELGPEAVGKGGIVRDPARHAEACRLVEVWLAVQPGWHVLGITPSPIEGAEGNREFLIVARYEPETRP